MEGEFSILAAGRGMGLISPACAQISNLCTLLLLEMRTRNVKSAISNVNGAFF
jgi:hypothetical protein